MREYQHRIAIAIAAVWVILLPLVLARLTSWLIGCDYAVGLAFYQPDLAIGAASVILLPAAWLRKRWAIVGLVVAALLLAALKMKSASPFAFAWMISSAVLFLVAWSAYKFVPGRAAQPKRMALRALLAPTFGLMAVGTPAAYMYFSAGVLAGFQGVGKGEYFLGVVLSLLSLAALYAIWTVWSLGRELWIRGTHVRPARNRLKDALGLLCAWIAFASFVALGESLYRVEEVIVFSVLLMPAVVLASAAVLWATLQGRSGSSSDSLGNVFPATAVGSTTMKLPDLPGVLSGIAITVLAIAFLVPRPTSGWGLCDLSIVFPMTGGLFLTERFESFDGCSTGIGYLTVLCGALSLVCFIAGAFTAATRRMAASRSGASAVAIAMACAMLTLVWRARFVEWPATLVVGIAAFAGATWVGYLGGRLGGKMREAISANRDVPAM
jgi:hypothetical protein